ncbi:MAG TPA: hypothetical protein VKY85_07775 [Candidatus Angelobacter sp.]|nr:hypothetical protein [Candidatus Angelobacter sp.]
MGQKRRFEIPPRYLKEMDEYLHSPEWLNHRRLEQARLCPRSQWPMEEGILPVGISQESFQASLQWLKRDDVIQAIENGTALVINPQKGTIRAEAKTRPRRNFARPAIFPLAWGALLLLACYVVHKFL